MLNFVVVLVLPVAYGIIYLGIMSSAGVLGDWADWAAIAFPVPFGFLASACVRTRLARTMLVVSLAPAASFLIMFASVVLFRLPHDAIPAAVYVILVGQQTIFVSLGVLLAQFVLPAHRHGTVRDLKPSNNRFEPTALHGEPITTPRGGSTG